MEHLRWDGCGGGGAGWNEHQESGTINSALSGFLGRKSGYLSRVYLEKDQESTASPPISEHSRSQRQTPSLKSLPPNCASAYQPVESDAQYVLHDGTIPMPLIYILPLKCRVHSASR
jgi:hypothetical protein